MKPSLIAYGADFRCRNAEQGLQQLSPSHWHRAQTMKLQSLHSCTGVLLGGLTTGDIRCEARKLPRRLLCAEHVLANCSQQPERCTSIAIQSSLLLGCDYQGVKQFNVDTCVDRRTNLFATIPQSLGTLSPVASDLPGSMSDSHTRSVQMVQMFEASTRHRCVERGGELAIGGQVS